MRTLGIIIAAFIFIAILVIFVYPDIIFDVMPNDRWRRKMTYAISIYGKDKLGHFFLTGISAFLLNFLLKGKTVLLFKKPFFFGSLFMMAFVTIEEIYQLWLPDRNFELLDMAFNLAGILIFEMLFKFFFKKDKRIKHTHQA